MAGPYDCDLIQRPAMKNYSSRIFYLREKVVFPYCAMRVELKAGPLSSGLSAGNTVITYPIRSLLDIFFNRRRMGTLVEIVGVEETGETVRLDIKGLSRVRIRRIRRLREASFVISEDTNSSQAQRLMEDLRKKAQELIFLINVEESDRLIGLLNYLVSINQLVDFITNYFVLDFPQRFRLLNETDVEKRGIMLQNVLDSLIGRMNERRNGGLK
jgi:ATP-dependent Lon protease